MILERLRVLFNFVFVPLYVLSSDAVFRGSGG